jgi:beta-lactamase superfamily II metal-dependent hydrolase
MSGASIEIHIINVGQGDAVLVVNRDLAALRAAIEHAGKPVPADPIDHLPFAVNEGVPLAGTVVAAMLVDGGDDEYGGDVVAYLETHGVLVPGTTYTPRLAVVVTHFHDDHMAGLRSVFRQRNPAKPPAPATIERYRPDAVYIPYTTNKTVPASERYRMFRADVDAAAAAAGDPTRVVTLCPGGIDLASGNPAVIDLGAGAGGIPVRAYAVAAAQGVYDGIRTVEIPSVTRKPDQNDRSIALVLEYGSFRCFLGGDMAGSGTAAGGNVGVNAVDPNSKAYYSTHADVESRLGPAMRRRFPATAVRIAGQPKYPSAGYCTILKVNHHGSSSSLDVNFLATLRPAVLVISSGLKSRFHRHPTQQVMNRATAARTAQWFVAGSAGAQVANSISGIYVTEIAQRYKGTVFATDIAHAGVLGDVVVRPVDDTVVAVQASAGAGTVPLSVQVYGTGDQTTVAGATTALRPTAAVAACAVYPIGPFIHTDQH